MLATEAELSRIRRTWALAAGDAEKTAAVFYDNLFRIDSDTRALFKTDMKQQGKKLTDTLGFIVDHLESEEALLSAARDLAIRHTSYGVVDGQYESVGAALIETFEQLLGASFEAEDNAAWSHVYGKLSAYMIEATA